MVPKGLKPFRPLALGRPLQRKLNEDILYDKHEESDEVLKLFMRPVSGNHDFLVEMKHEEKESILPNNISSSSLFTNKEKERNLFNSKSSFTKIKGVVVHESIRKETEGNDKILFEYKK